MYYNTISMLALFNYNRTNVQFWYLFKYGQQYKCSHLKVKLHPFPWSIAFDLSFSSGTIKYEDKTSSLFNRVGLMKNKRLSLIFTALIAVGMAQPILPAQSPLAQADYTPQKIAVYVGLAASAGYIMWKLYQSRAGLAEPALVNAISELDLKAEDAAERAIFFDLGDVLVVTNGTAALKEVGLKRFLAYAAYNPGNLLSLQTMVREKLLFPFLNDLCPRRDDEVGACDAHDCLLPQIMCDWLAGKKTNEAIRKEIKNHLNVYAFKNDAEKDLLRSLTRMMFTPKKLINTLELAPGAYALVNRYVRAGVPVGIISNMEFEVYQQLEKKYPEFFALFKWKIVSGAAEVQAIKPGDQIYYKVKEIVGNPATCAIPDDRPENNAMAKEMGFHAIACPSTRGWASWKKMPNLTHVQQKLDKWLKNPIVSALPATA